ncbi:MAG: prepilin-type N-terminal cleavage/methylation domain-containing protein [Clostridia bacterium]|nr:prepilin-type N-terminal cleavage/methylation domain-containing protein [Clostridia bacterium]
MKHSKKGFTLVELLVVIAILAILATVSVVGYTSFIAKANLSNDQATITMINKVLMAEEVFGKPETITEALDALRANGFSYEKQVPYSTGYHYGYHQTTNRFYLLDKTNNVCYPEGATVAVNELWIPYRDHASSMVPGISLYYAVGTISNQQEFASAFANGPYVLDLNGNVCTVSKGSAQVEVQNGIVISDDFATGEQNGVQTIIKDKAPVDTTSQGVIVKRVYTNTLNPEGVGSGSSTLQNIQEIEYVDCVFTEHIGFYQYYDKGYNVTFTNCKFINTGKDKFAVVLQPGSQSGSNGPVYGGPTVDSPSIVTFDGCEFISCDRGIHISDWEYTTVNITNCKFSMNTGASSYNCIQISNYDSDAELASLKINFTNNTVASANGVVYFHDAMTDPQNLESFKAVFGTFSGNTYATNVVKIADRGQYSEGHALYNNQTAMEELATYVK